MRSGPVKEIAMRSIALAALAALCVSNSAIAAPSTAGRTVFEVLRNGQPFGRHSVVVSGADGNLRAQTNVALRVGAGPVTLYHYEQACIETWNSGALSALECSTLKEGRRTRVRAATQAGQLRVTGSRGDVVFAPGALPTSWWTRPPTSIDSMIDTETGARMPLRVTRVGRESFVAGGQTIQADHIRVQGTLAVDLWYDVQGRWVGCAFTIRGQHIEYRLETPLGNAPA